ncbi:hypothetical protein F8388_027054 [Cannabis sativa]|uniref:Uncharacterized protein n=1 Tax=Cannabis sativa TaxID=3483 RepID=A0A7J6GY00_CANSA|nr:hypothetical protein F8388_027054 [Cannabis sativa]KAF4387842.1 hypothetical protein G4B88_004169 [Cannabis sativa]KAF4399801.1 hypothetical protein G4B88_022884 [Cannabis sativa]
MRIDPKTTTAAPSSPILVSSSSSKAFSIASDEVKKKLKISAKFGVCVANNFCDCLVVPYQPVVYACLAELGFKCMKNALSNSAP